MSSVFDKLKSKQVIEESEEPIEGFTSAILNEDEWEPVEVKTPFKEEKKETFDDEEREDEVKKLNLNVLEKDLIASFLASKKIWLSFAQHIFPENFEYENSKFVFKIFTFYFDKYGEMPTQTQVISLSRTGQFGELTDAIVSGFDSFVEYIYTKQFREDEMNYLYDSVHGFVKRNKMKNALIKGVTLIDDYTKYVEVENAVRDVIMWNENMDMGFEIAKDVEERYLLIEKLKENGFESPWKSLNEIIGGQFYQQELTIFLSPTGVGKSLALANIASWARNKLQKVIVYISLELSALRLSQRFDANIGNIDFLETPNNIQIIKDKWGGVKGNGRLYVKEFDEGKVTIDDIHEYVYKLQYFEGVKVQGIIVDHIDAMSPKMNKYGKNATAYTEAGVITQELRALARANKCPVLTATQANRAGYNVSVEEFSSEHLGDSIKKVQTADNMIAIVANNDNRRDNIAFMKTLKTRNGKPFRHFQIKTDYPKMRFTEVK